MVKHLRLAHRLLLDGNRARDPWAVIEDWVASYHKTGDRSLLPRCFELVQHFDGEDGNGRLRQLLTTGRIDAGQVRPELLEQARRAGASICPTCSALVPGRADAPADQLAIAQGRLAAAGFCVEVSERGLVPQLAVEVPEQIIYHGREDGPRWTPRGLSLLLTGPPIVVAVILALMHRFLEVRVGIGVLLALAAALLAFLFVRIRVLLSEPILDRAIGHGWARLVPLLHSDGFSPEDSAFLAGFALSSIGRGLPPQRERLLGQMIDRTEKAVLAGTGSAAQAGGALAAGGVGCRDPGKRPGVAGGPAYQPLPGGQSAIGRSGTIAGTLGGPLVDNR